MDIQKRLTRKPMTTVLWTVLVAAMTLLLGVGCALLYSSGSLVGILDSYHTSIAVRTDREHWESGFGGIEFEDKAFDEEDAAYFKSLDCVEEVYFHTLSAVYCPDFIPAISAGGAYYNCDYSYADVMLIGEVTELSPLQDYSAIYGYEDGSVGIYGVLKIEEIILQNTDLTRRINGYGDEYLNFSVGVPDLETAEYIQIGNRYVFFGWYDPLSHGLGLDDGVTITPIHPWVKPFYECELVGNSLLQADYYYSQPPVYAQAVVTRIEGTWEEFLADPANAIYQQMMERWEKQQHSLAVLGTDNLNAMYAFTASAANVVTGRSFTQEEYDSGAKVCILNESMAVKADISVGDTITLEQYLCHDNEPHENYNWSTDTNEIDGMLNNPNIGHFNFHTEYAAAEEFTVVGLYRVRNEWEDASYSFSPNTVFIPKAAQIEGASGGPSREVIVHEWVDPEGKTQYITDTAVEGTYGIYFSMKLKNGQVSDFEALMEEDARFAGQFITVDQGFGPILEILNGITASSARLTGVVLAGWGLLLALYVLLYQGKQKRNIGIMRSLGAEPREAWQYLFGSGMVVAAVGVAIGSVAAGAVMGIVQSKLFDTAFAGGGSQYSISVLTEDAVNVMVSDSTLPIWGLLLLALAELVVFGVILGLHARNLSNQPPRELMTK